MEKLKAVQPKQVVLEVVVDRSCAEFAAVEMKEAAFLDWQLYHNRSKRHSDALNGLIQTS
jgi:hypothetical protein